MTSLDRRQFLLSTSAGALAAAIPIPGVAARSVVPILNRRNAYEQTNLAASKGSYGTNLGDTNALYFASGTEGETAGLFGSLRYIGDR